MSRVLDAPLDVYWSLTQGCNLACTFCMTSSGPGVTQGDLTRSQRDRVLEMILESGALRVVLTGGEPLAVPGCLEIVAALRGRGIGVKITTNGTLLRPPVVAALAAHGVRLQFSVESEDPGVNDALMGGTDTYARILSGLRRCREAGIACEVKVVAQAANIRRLGPLYDELHALGVEKIDVSEVSPLGRAMETWEDLEPSLADLEAAAAEAEAARARGVPVIFSASRLQNRAAGTPALCSLGSPRPRSLLIDERGDVRPCSASQSFGWKNPVLEHGLIGAWERLTELGHYRETDHLEGECVGCELVETCKGGCRGIAYGVWGNLAGPDPYCPKIGAREQRAAYGRRIHPVRMVFPGGAQRRA